ncbi:MAG: 6-phosphogluconolactonase [Pseudomonadota bacterium]
MFIQQFFDSRERTASVLADEIAGHLRAAIDARGLATLVLSGGSSPLATLNALATRELDWSKVTVLASDERWVDEQDPASNAAMIRRELLRERAEQARLVSLYEPNVAAPDALAAINARVDALPMPFDYVLLGMGDDGHTASLFPDDPDIAAALVSRQACVLASPPSQPLLRISLTPNALLNARSLGLLFFGQSKADVFAQASLDGDLSEFPVRAVLRQEIVPVTTFYAQ